MSLNLRFGFLTILCLAHLAGAISLKKGGRKGLVYFKSFKLKFKRIILNLVSLTPYIFLNSLGSVLKAVNAMKGQIGLICVGTGPPAIISSTSLATSVYNK